MYPFFTIDFIPWDEWSGFEENSTLAIWDFDRL